jgi:hypothetical protein
MYPASRTYKGEVYEYHRANVLAINDVASWLKEYRSGLWYRSGFNSIIKYDCITNNISEVFNNWIKDHKDLPICDLADKIRVMLLELFFRRQIVDKLTGKILPSILNILRARTRGHEEEAKTESHKTMVSKRTIYAITSSSRWWSFSAFG